MVGVRGLEPPTSASRTLRASQLRHTPIVYTALILTERSTIFIMLAVIACLSGILSILAIAEFLWRNKILKGEYLRKFVHGSSGMFIAFWPWFISWQAIRGIGFAMATVIIANRAFGALHFSTRLERFTVGEIVFALAVSLSAMLTDVKVFFMTGMLVLALSDSGAALFGMRYGEKWQYKIFGQRKTVIGSMACWLISLAVLGVGLLFANVLSFPHYILTIVILPPILTVLENLGVFGLDNVLLPAATIVFLRIIT